jgi:hypothetical protein
LSQTERRAQELSLELGKRGSDDATPTVNDANSTASKLRFQPEALPATRDHE